MNDKHRETGSTGSEAKAECASQERYSATVVAGRADGGSKSGTWRGDITFGGVAQPDSGGDGKCSEEARRRSPHGGKEIVRCGGQESSVFGRL